MKDGWKGESKVPVETTAMAAAFGSWEGRGEVRGDVRIGDGADLALPAFCSAACF